MTQGVALNIERDTNCYTKNSIPQPPKVVHDDVTVTVQSRFGRFLVARVLGQFGLSATLYIEYEFVLDGNTFKSVNGKLL